MKTPKWLRSARALIPICLLLSAGPAFAQLYTFEAIADTRSDFTDLSLSPSINAAGTVAFRAESAGGSGIFTGSGGALTPVADSSSFADFGNADPRINAAGTVAFFANQLGGGSGIFVNSAGVNSKIAATSDNFSAGDLFETFGSPSINGSGVVAFTAAAASGDLGVFTGTAGGAPARVGPAAAGTFSAVAGRAFINPNGAVAVVATTTGGDTQLLTALPPAEFDVAVATSGALFSAIESVSPYLTSDGLSVVVLGTREDTGERGIFRITGGMVTTLVDSSGGFQDFTDFALAADGSLLAFSAVTDDSRVGIFNGADSLLNQVVVTGDMLLFGSELRQVDSLAFGESGLNDAGQIAFYATFTDSIVGEPGFAGVFRASPIPEPGVTALFAFGGAALLFSFCRSQATARRRQR